MANKEIGRRSFLKKLGIAGAVVSGASMASCSSDNKTAQKWSVEGTGGEPTGAHALVQMEVYSVTTHLQ